MLKSDKMMGIITNIANGFKLLLNKAKPIQFKQPLQPPLLPARWSCKMPARHPFSVTGASEAACRSKPLGI